MRKQMRDIGADICSLREDSHLSFDKISKRMGLSVRRVTKEYYNHINGRCLRCGAKLRRKNIEDYCSPCLESIKKDSKKFSSLKIETKVNLWKKEQKQKLIDLGLLHEDPWNKEDTFEIDPCSMEKYKI